MESLGSEKVGRVKKANYTQGICLAIFGHFGHFLGIFCAFSLQFQKWFWNWFLLMLCVPLYQWQNLIFPAWLFVVNFNLCYAEECNSAIYAELQCIIGAIDMQRHLGWLQLEPSVAGIDVMQLSVDCPPVKPPKPFLPAPTALYTPHSYQPRTPALFNVGLGYLCPESYFPGIFLTIYAQH